MSGGKVSGGKMSGGKMSGGKVSYIQFETARTGHGLDMRHQH